MQVSIIQDLGKTIEFEGDIIGISHFGYDTPLAEGTIYKTAGGKYVAQVKTLYPGKLAFNINRAEVFTRAIDLFHMVDCADVTFRDHPTTPMAIRKALRNAAAKDPAIKAVMTRRVV